MTEIQSAVGRIQLRRLDMWNERRVQNMEFIWDALSAIPFLRIPSFNCDVGSLSTGCSEGCRHAAYKCYVFVESGPDVRNALLADMNQRHFPCFSGSCSEVYLEEAFKNTSFRPEKRQMLNVWVKQV